MRRLLFVSLLFLLLFHHAHAQEGVSDARFDRLSRGINLPFWFWYAPETESGIRDRFSDEDFQLIHDLGFTFVRVPIDLGFLLD